MSGTELETFVGKSLLKAHSRGGMQKCINLIVFILESIFFEL